MGSSVTGQDESNPALWLATRAGKMELSCNVPREKLSPTSHNKSFIDKACSAKMAWYWPCSFFYKQAKKIGQYPAILTSNMVNNQYITYSLKTGSLDDAIQEFL